MYSLCVCTNVQCIHRLSNIKMLTNNQPILYDKDNWYFKILSNLISRFNYILLNAIKVKKVIKLISNNKAKSNLFFIRYL